MVFFDLCMASSSSLSASPEGIPLSGLAFVSPESIPLSGFSVASPESVPLSGSPLAPPESVTLSGFALGSHVTVCDMVAGTSRSLGFASNRLSEDFRTSANKLTPRFRVVRNILI